MLGVGVSKKTYLDDVFSTYVWEGNATSRSFNNGIDLSGEGGLTWIKRRDGSNNHQLIDTVRGVTKYLDSAVDSAEATETQGLTAFNNNGFTIGNAQPYNGNTDDYSSWSFRKTPGFFDVVTFNTGSTLSSNLRISHSLGCVPGMILIKNLEDSEHWYVYHRDTGNQGVLHLNQEDAVDLESFTVFDPTATDFGFNTSQMTSTNKDTVAYVFAGGESTAATANCIGFDSSSDKITCGNSSNTTADFNFGTGAFTIECWIKAASSQTTYPRVITVGPQWNTDHAAIYWDHDTYGSKVSFIAYNNATSALLESSTKGFNGDGQWHHVAVSRSGDTWRLFVDGILEDTATWTGSLNSADSYCTIGNSPDTYSTGYFNGEISNVRVVKGTAVYTSSFRPPTEPLTDITNTKLLCCNAASATSATVTPITLTESSVSENNTDSPFDDPAGFVFGDAGDQNVIKCGSYKGNDSSDGPEINLGWEPQYVLIKNSGTASTPWQIFDSMRGVATGGNDIYLRADTNSSEYTGHERISFTPTGFKIDANSSYVNENNKKIIYMAIRRPDGYVGKPAEAGTDVFAMDTGNGSTTIPAFDSGFIVDMNMNRKPASTWSWQLGTRLQGKDQLNPNTNAAEAGELDKYVWDSNAGFGADSGYDSSYQSWMWKRHAGFDVVTYKGNGTAGHQISHSLNKIPEMIWVKNRDETQGWRVYHKGLNGGTNPEQYRLILNLTSDESSSSTDWNNTSPTSYTFTLGTDNAVNEDDKKHIAMLFASVDGISKVGSYTGNGSATERTITLGFQPRFIIIKNADGTNSWEVLDTTRGWGSGGDERLWLDGNWAQDGDTNVGAPTSTGFTLATEYTGMNANNNTYIYYAHA